MTQILFGNVPLANCEINVLAADHRPAHCKDRDLDHACSMGRARTEVGLIPTHHHHHNFSTTYKTCTHIHTGMIAYLGGVSTLHVGTVIILLYVAKSTSSIHVLETMQPTPLEQDGYGGIPGCRTDTPAYYCRYHTLKCYRYHVNHTWLFIAKAEMAMRCRGVVEKEV